MELPFVLEALLPPACAWAEAQERRVIDLGVSLTQDELNMARIVGVRQPERVRILKVAFIPAPDDPTLCLAAAKARLSLEHSGGMALRYGIFIRADQASNQETLAHELTHTAQYERLGGIEPFFRRYFTECLTVGYWQSPLEMEAVQAARNYVHEKRRVL